MADEHGRYSKVYRRIWRDEKFRRLTDNGKLLFFRMMTGPELGSIPGVLAATEAGLAASLGWDEEVFGKAFAEAFGEGLFRVDAEAGLIWLPNACRYNRPESPNVVIGWRREWPEVPECPLKCEILRDLRAFTEGLGEPFAKAFAQAFGKPCPNQEQEQEQEQYRGTPPSADPPKPAGSGARRAYKLTPPDTDRRGKPNGLRHITPTTPTDGLDEVDLCRRRYAAMWAEEGMYENIPYPDQPGADRKAIGELLGYHRRNKLAYPWKAWVSAMFAAYLEIRDDKLVTGGGHALRFLPGSMTRIVPKVAREMKE